MSFINPIRSNYILRLPQGWLYKSIKDKYDFILKRLPIPYNTLEDYISSSITKFTLRGAGFEPVEQRLYEDPVKWKSGFNYKNILDRVISIEFKIYEHFWNYLIMYDQFIEYLDYDNKEEFMPDLIMFLLDHTGHAIYKIHYKQLVYKSISDLDLDYSIHESGFTTFTCEFNYNYFEMKEMIEDFNLNF